MRILLSILIVFGLTSCNLFEGYQANVQQGNIITKKMVSQLKPGMSTRAVQTLLGSPVLVNTFNDYRLNYVYTMRIGRGEMATKRLTLSFNRGKLKSFKSA